MRPMKIQEEYIQEALPNRALVHMGIPEGVEPPTVGNSDIPSTNAAKKLYPGALEKSCRITSPNPTPQNPYIPEAPNPKTPTP